MSRLWFRVLILIIGALSLKMPARAYEGDHYVWTYYLARHCGYTHRQAFQIASAAYAIDFDPNTGPMPEGADQVRILNGYSPPEFRRKWTKFHAFASSELETTKGDVKAEIRRNAQVLYTSGLQQRNPGPYLHFIQDIEAHAGFNDFRGHLLAGHVPDFMSYKPDRARRMTESTLSALDKIRLELLGKSAITVKKGRLDSVLAALIKSDPYPPEFDKLYSPDKPILLLGNARWLLERSPLYSKSYQVVLKALYEDYQSGMLASFPDKTINERDPSLVAKLQSHDWKPVMPENWRQYSFDRDGRGIEDGSYALEDIKVTFDAPTVKVEVPSEELLGDEAFRALVPQYGDPARKARRVTVKLPYHLRGVVPSLGPLPIVEHVALGDKVVPTFWGKHTLVRYVATKGFDAELELTTFVSTDECEKNKVQLSAAIQIQGEDPHWENYYLILTNGTYRLSREPRAPDSWVIFTVEADANTRWLFVRQRAEFEAPLAMSEILFGGQSSAPAQKTLVTLPEGAEFPSRAAAHKAIVKYLTELTWEYSPLTRPKEFIQAQVQGVRCYPDLSGDSNRYYNAGKTLSELRQVLPALTPRKSFPSQWLVHATGHGTYDGSVKDDLWMMVATGLNTQNKTFTKPDGSGGTFGYSYDQALGPFTESYALLEAMRRVKVRVVETSANHAV